MWPGGPPTRDVLEETAFSVTCVLFPSVFYLFCLVPVYMIGASTLCKLSPLAARSSSFPHWQPPRPWHAMQLGSDQCLSMIISSRPLDQVPMFRAKRQTRAQPRAAASALRGCTATHTPLSTRSDSYDGCGTVSTTWLHRCARASTSFTSKMRLSI
eukprot:2921988-Rhodomonas_salina.2